MKYIMVVHIPNRRDLTVREALRVAEARVRERLKAIPSVKTVEPYIDEDRTHLPSFLEITSEDDIFDALKTVGETFFGAGNSTAKA